MTALIFPGVIAVDSLNPAIGIADGAVAGVPAWKKCPLIVCVLAAIAVDFVLYILLFDLKFLQNEKMRRKHASVFAVFVTASCSV